LALRPIEGRARYEKRPIGRVTKRRNGAIGHLGDPVIIGNPVRVGSGPAAVAPPCRKQSAGNLAAGFSPLSLFCDGKAVDRAEKPEDLPVAIRVKRTDADSVDFSVRWPG